MFVGCISRETEDAILLEQSAAAHPLMGLAHEIHSLERESRIEEPIPIAASGQRIVFETTTNSPATESSFPASLMDDFEKSTRNGASAV